MKLNNSQLINYKDKIKFSNEDKKKHQDQIDYLVSSVESKIKEHVDTKVLKVLQSGSWKKGTIIKPMDDTPIDIDLVFYLDIGYDDYSTLHRANDLILPILKSIYPQKNDAEFWNNTKTAGLEFVTSGLNVDIVPVGKTNNSDYVAQPSENQTIYYTSPTKQLEFISDRKNANPNYSTIVRILKKWKNFHGVNLPSFAIELIIAHLEINKGVEIDIYESILRFFRLVSKKQFPVLLFNAPQGSYQEDGSHVYIADPTYEENNIVKSITDLEWNQIRIKADTAFETLLLAEEEEYITTTIDLWKEVFGPDFNIDAI